MIGMFEQIVITKYYSLIFSKNSQFWGIFKSGVGHITLILVTNFNYLPISEKFPVEHRRKTLFNSILLYII